MRSSVRKLIWVAAAAFLLVAAVALSLHLSTPSLVLTDRESGKTFARFSFDDDDTFSISFIHSVNQSAVTDYYRRGEDNSFILYATHFHAYGAGIPESWPEGAIVETSPAGIHVRNLHISLPDVTYIVGTVSDHTLTIGEKNISLRDLCGQNAEVLFILS